jgi:hypothetical protein
MNEMSNHSSAWVSFTYINMMASAALTLGGLFFLPIDLWIKGYMLMGISMLTTATVILTKTLRDKQESARLVNKIEEARTERILAGLKD